MAEKSNWKLKVLWDYTVELDIDGGTITFRRMEVKNVGEEDFPAGRQGMIKAFPVNEAGVPGNERTLLDTFSLPMIPAGETRPIGPFEAPLFEDMKLSRDKWAFSFYVMGIGDNPDVEIYRSKAIELNPDFNLTRKSPTVMTKNGTDFAARWTQEKISSDFLRTLKRMDKEEVTQAIVIFEEQLSKNQQQILQVAEAEAKSDKVHILESSAQKAQESVTEFFEKEAKEYFTGIKDVDFERLGVVKLPLLNTMVVPVTPKLVEDIVAKPSVIGVIQNQHCQIIQPLRTEQRDIVQREVRDGITWGLKRLKVDKIWEEGFKGKGVRIGHLDTGVYPAHPDLQGKVVEWMAFSPQGRQLVGCPVYDSASHGTHTAGTIVGGRDSGISIGVAPEAKLVSGLVTPNGSGTLTQVLNGMNWIIDEDIQVLNMSIGFSRYEPRFDYYVDRLLLLDIFPSFAIGNDSHGNTRSPGNMRFACGVGAIDYDSEAAQFSGGATLSFYNRNNSKHTHVIKPDITAPGVAVLSAVPPLTEGVEINGNFYSWLNGTSMATAYVSGIAALLVQAAPTKRVREIIDALYQTARPAGEGGHNNRYGRGIIEPLRALQRLTKT